MAEIHDLSRPMVGVNARAFSGKVDTGFPQKMRPNKESRAHSDSTEMESALDVVGYFDRDDRSSLKSPVISADNRAPPTKPITAPIDTRGYSWEENHT